MNNDNNLNSYVQALQLMGIKYNVVDGNDDYSSICIPLMNNTLSELEILSRLRYIRRMMIKNGIDMEINIVSGGYIIKR